MSARRITLGRAGDPGAQARARAGGTGRAAGMTGPVTWRTAARTTCGSCSGATSISTVSAVRERWRGSRGGAPGERGGGGGAGEPRRGQWGVAGAAGLDDLAVLRRALRPRSRLAGDVGAAV